MLTGEHTPMSRRLVSRHVIGAAVSGATKLITVSELVKEQLLAEFGAQEEKVCVVPNGCDHLPVLEREDKEGGPLLSVGHLEPRKNVQLLIEALSLDEALGELVLIGAPKGSEQDLLQALAKERGVSERVRFAGVVGDDELAELYAQCSACVFPSKLEGFGIGVAEAMRAGAPVAIARGTAMDEVAAGCCVEFDADDPTDCVRAVHSAISMETKALDAARERATAFSWDQSAEELARMWHAAMADTAAS
jgi:glycosyltransferase involved in cell wall biosynthesis